MLTPKFITENLELIKDNYKKRNYTFDFDKFLELEKKRLNLIKITEEKKALRNQVSKEIGQNKKNGQEPSREKIERMREIGNEINQHDKDFFSLMEKINYFCLHLPNILSNDVPEGKDETNNQLIQVVGTKPKFDFTVKDHVALLEENNWSDFEKSAKITGSRFAILKGEVAHLKRALANFLLDENLAAGYQEYHPPVLVNHNSLQNTGQLPKFEEDVFSLGKDYNHLYLIPTAEVPLINLHANEILKSDELPKRYVAYTQCFRSEAGSAGKDTKGLIRLHEFSKVELVNITLAEESENAHQKMVEQIGKILQLLELPYRVVLLSAGDTGFTAQKCYDFEVWLPGQNTYREISSCSNCGPFQSQRAMIRYKNHQEKIELAHTLNGSCLPIGRTIVAILENHQQADGSIYIPQVLAKYLGKDFIGRK